MSKKLTQIDMAGILKVDTKTLYNWRKNKPELYKIVMFGFKFQEFLEKSKENINELEEIMYQKKEFKRKHQNSRILTKLFCDLSCMPN